MFLFIFLSLVGLLLFVFPKRVWEFTEMWKSSYATEPSDLYIITTRVGGAICTLIGLAGIITLILL